ncbi:MAG TPA: hypothetical protein VKB26_12600 [Candidatus Acidoferrales bacterium]|nr:hypothetical protein [Candidatus Acidoferrales bacterium]
MNAEEHGTKAANEMESDLEEREEGAHERDVMLQKKVNQDVQTGTNDATHPGIKWGSSYKTKRKVSSRNRAKKRTNDSESAP